VFVLRLRAAARRSRAGSVSSSPRSAMKRAHCAPRRNEHHAALAATAQGWDVERSL